MRDWNYTYKTSDGSWHEGEISASSKDAVYAALREKGIRPIKVTERIAPVVRRGFAGLRKRDWAIVAAVLIVLALVVVRLPSRSASPGSPETQSGVMSGRPASACPRHCIDDIPGDFADRLDGLFMFASERFLAKHAQPGRDVASEGSLEDIALSLDSPILVYPNDPIWLVELKGIVTAMKGEVELLMKSGKAPKEIAVWVTERQRMEASYRRQILSGTGSDEEKQAKLKALGLL